MRSGLAWSICLLVGCHGEPLEQTPVDAAPADAVTADTSTATSDADAPMPDAAPDAAEAGACADVPGNLLTDGSFERWTGATSASWQGPLTRVETSPFHCASAARFTSASYGDIRQEIAFATPLAAGTELEITMAARWISGVTRAPAFNFYFHASDGSSVGGLVAVTMAGFKADGSWYEGGGRVLVPGLASKAFFHVVSERPEPQTFDLDKVTVRVVP